MKKFILLMLTVFSFGSMHALPVGNPAGGSLICDGVFWEGSCCLDPCDPCAIWSDLVSVRVGYYGDFVYNRHLEVDDSIQNGTIEHTEIYTNAGYLVLNLWDRFDIFSTLGATHLLMSTNARAFAPSIAQTGIRFDVETDTAFSWSIGVRRALWECGCTTIGVEAQYFQTCPDIIRLTSFESLSIYPDDTPLKYCEWQIGLGIARRINNLIPYIALKFSRAKVDMDRAVFGQTTLFDLENDRYWGYAAGVTLVDCEKMAFTGEWRFGDEKAFYVNAQFRL